MYSLEERLLAVKTYYEMGRNAKATVRRLGYPDESNISRWVKEYEGDQDLHEHRVRYSKYTDAEKQTAIPVLDPIIMASCHACSMIHHGDSDYQIRKAG